MTTDEQIRELQRQAAEADAARRHAQEVSSELVKEKRALEAENECKDTLIETLQAQVSERTEELEAARADNRTYINERHENMKQIESLQAELERVRGDMPSETIASVTAWANETFGAATVLAQIMRVEKEWLELKSLLGSGTSLGKIAEEAADVCICLYRVIGTLDPEAINKKMAKNRARKWQVDGQGCAQHVE